MGSHVFNLDQLKLGDAVSIDRTCDRFESAIRAGSQPRIEDFLSNQPEAIRRPLFRELLSLEIQLRLKLGGEKTLTASDYWERFHDLRDDIQVVFHATLSPESVKSANSPQSNPNNGLKVGPSSQLELPHQLGGYRLESFLAQGGMGIVYRAVQLSMNRQVAVKLIHSHQFKNAEALARFQREIHTLAQLHHRNIVVAYDAGEVDGLHYLAMELVTGWDLARVCDCCGTLPIPVACECIRQAALGLQHVHEHGLVHRDIKPSNLMLTNDGEVKLLDLGLARLHENELDERLTRESVPMGTVEYMAPEQARNPHSVDIRADLYSLGGSLFKLLCGFSPFCRPARSPTEILVAHMESPPPHVRDHRPEVPIELDSLVARLLSKELAERPQTPSEVVAALKPFAAGDLLPPFAIALQSLANDQGVLPKKSPTPGIKTETVSRNEDETTDTYVHEDEPIDVVSSAPVVSDNSLVRRRTWWTLMALTVVGSIAAVLWFGIGQRPAVIDLLSAFDLHRQVVLGDWSFDNNELLSPKNGIGCVRLANEYVSDFRLELTAKLHEGGSWAIVSSSDPSFAIVFAPTLVAADVRDIAADNSPNQHVWSGDWGDFADTSDRRFVVELRDSQLTLRRDNQLVMQVTVPETGELELLDLPPAVLRRPGLYLLTTSSLFRFREIKWTHSNAVGGAP